MQEVPTREDVLQDEMKARGRRPAVSYARPAAPSWIPGMQGLTNRWAEYQRQSASQWLAKTQKDWEDGQAKFAELAPKLTEEQKPKQLEKMQRLHRLRDAALRDWLRLTDPST